MTFKNIFSFSKLTATVITWSCPRQFPLAARIYESYPINDDKYVLGLTIRKNSETSIYL